VTSIGANTINLSADCTYTNLSAAGLVERALAGGEGHLANNGALVCRTGDRTGRSPNDKYLEDTPRIHDKVWWGKVNKPLSPERFEEAFAIASEHLNGAEARFVFDGWAGADVHHRLGVRVITEQAWHALFAQTLFIEPGSASDPSRLPWKHDWTVINAGRRRLTGEEQARFGVESPVLIAQSLERKTVVILGTEYAGEMKKSIFYAMNFDMPEQGVFPMHCSANVDRRDPTNVALFFADPDRSLIGDDEHGWGPNGVFNFEGGCYAKCIRLSEAGEPQIWNAIRFGSVLENTVVDAKTRQPDYDDGSITENTRVTYPVDFIPGATIPSVCGHPKNIIFLTADAYGVLPPVAKLTPEQAMYYFINGYTSKLAGTEAGVTEPVPNFSPCFGGPFLPRRPSEYAQMLADRIKKYKANVWLLNTGWTGGAYGQGHRMELGYTRAMVTGILDGTLAREDFDTDPFFGLAVPRHARGVPAGVLHPADAWSDKAAYEKQAHALAEKFRANEQNFTISDEVRAAGPKG
jgi:phosphoenolpyruvate carboxykinase (ATP)